MIDSLPSGQYRILPARISAPPPFPIGANLEEAPTASPVISGGDSNVWNVERLESGYYTLSLVAGENWFSRDDQDNVVVVPESAAGEWAIESRNGAYTIASPGFWPIRAWYLPGTLPGTKVMLRFFEISPWPQQLFTFIPAN